MRLLAALAAAALAAGTALAPAARAAVIAVETSADGAVGPLCGLRDAIVAANEDRPVGGCDEGDPGADVIDLTGLPELPDVILLDSDLPPIVDDVTLLGPGADQLTVSGQDASAVIAVGGGDVVIEGLTLADGVSGRGGCLSIQGFDPPPTLLLRDARVTSCAGFNGGGIAVDGADVRIERCLVDANATTGNSGGGLVHGGGRLEIVNSTFSGNATTGANRPGGGVASFAAESGPATVLVVHGSTFAGNGATAAGGNLFVAAGVSATLTHTLLAEAVSGGNCAGAITSAGHNLSDDSSCVFVGEGDLETAADLDVLADNGGPTSTRALLAGSAAIDGGAATCPDPDGATLATDQRGAGFPRRTDGDLDGQARCDIGAFEVAPEPAASALAAGAAGMLAWLARRRRARLPSGG